MPVDKVLAALEPNDLPSIRRLRARGPRKIWDKFDRELYRQRLEGALLGRMAGCTLGAPVEGYAIDRMKAVAEQCGDAFPPVRYWKTVPDPKGKRYGLSLRESYTRTHLDG